MQENSPPGNSAAAEVPGIPERKSTAPQIISDDPTSSFAFDWSDFLDFNLDENFSISFPQHEQPRTDQSNQSEILGKVRKRDPRLVCSNFLAGRVPCACPEMDAMLEEEEKESVLQGNKRARVARISSVGSVRCQVLGCEVDISQLKGYHKRHRVCLECANASLVMFDGVNKRYCQQCGKFHFLSDFDDGKRSCRRKLERHNRRRRKDANSEFEKENQQIISTDGVSGEDEAVKDDICVSSQIGEFAELPESDGHVSTSCSALGSHSLQSDGILSTAEPKENKNPKYKRSSSFYEKSTFSSVCPSNRISFKLYNWNPAEFPRRLRHQIFHWLANMPIELEEYIRPGCTILTVFTAMPKPMWLKLFEEPALCIKDLIAFPRSMLFRRGTMRVYLNNKVFHVTGDTSSIVKVKVSDRVPKLHYIYPTFFEAGKPMEFVACGTNLLQPNFRFLISFAGRYLAYNMAVSSMCHERGDTESFDHQLLKIFVPQTDMELFGPAFIEVENQSGLSDFIPILVGDKEVCTEMEILLKSFSLPLFSQERFSNPMSVCAFLARRQSQCSEFVLDVAWSLKKPASEQQLTSLHIQRFNHLLNFLSEKESSVVLERVLCSVKNKLDNINVAGICDADLKLLLKNMDIAQNMLGWKSSKEDFPLLPASGRLFYSQSLQNENQSVDRANNKKLLENINGVIVITPSQSEGACAPLLKKEMIVKVNLQEKPRKSSSRLLMSNFATSRSVIMAIVTIGVCCGVCAVVLHPQRVTEIATAIQFRILSS